MSSARCLNRPWTLTPFLYTGLLRRLSKKSQLQFPIFSNLRGHSNVSPADTSEPEISPLSSTTSAANHLNPSPSDYSRSVFSDRCSLTVHTGAGGHGCISFLRDKYISAGPANGGDGGSGGNVYIQAVRGDTSLHKLARKGALKAGRGKNGRGKSRGGERGEDILLQVPVGTVVTETARWDPLAQEQEEQVGGGLSTSENRAREDHRGARSKSKWLLHPSSPPSEYLTSAFPDLPGPRQSNLMLAQAPSPINLDLSTPTERPILLAAGAVGGLGNPHFVSKANPRPKFATRGEPGMWISLDLELKILADVGLVGFPNAGKSTLLRALSCSRARVGDWAFTTLQPNIGTVVLDDYYGRPLVLSPSSRASRSPRDRGNEARTRFTVADIPGLVEDAHLDRGLGLGFLRHIERAQVLAFVVDLSQADAVQAVQKLWNEIRAYENLRGDSTGASTGSSSGVRTLPNGETLIEWTPFGSTTTTNKSTPPAAPRPVAISHKPWFVVATKADLPHTQDNFHALVSYLDQLSPDKNDHHHHPNRQPDRTTIQAVPVSAINAQGIDRVVKLAAGLLD